MRKNNTRKVRMRKTKPTNPSCNGCDEFSQPVNYLPPMLSDNPALYEVIPVGEPEKSTTTRHFSPSPPEISLGFDSTSFTVFPKDPDSGTQFADPLIQLRNELFKESLQKLPLIAETIYEDVPTKCQQSVLVQSAVLFGQCLYDTLKRADIKVTNSSSSIVEFSIQGAKIFETHPLPGQLYVDSLSGRFPAKQETLLPVTFLPGSPGKFERIIRVCFPNDTDAIVNVSGEAAFKHVLVDLPRNGKKAIPSFRDIVLEDEQAVRKWAKAAVKKIQKSHKNVHTDKGQGDIPILPVPYPGILNYALLPRYILDFGVLSTSNPEPQLRTVRITNPTQWSVEFGLVQTNDILRKSIRVDFDRHVVLAPGQSTSVRFTLLVKEHGLGCSECAVPFVIQDGPTFTIVVKADIRQPQMELRFGCWPSGSDRTLLCHLAHQTKLPLVNFGLVRCGYSSVQYLQLANSSHVPIQWEAVGRDVDFPVLAKGMNPIQRSSLKDHRSSRPIFILHPMKGPLDPKESVNLQVEFRPNNTGPCNYAWKIATPGSGNIIIIRATGTGALPRIVLSTEKINFGSILPFSAGQERTLVLRNPCPFPVEVFCLELDTQYAAECELLDHVEEFSRQRDVLFPVRTSGGGLPTELWEAYGKPSGESESVSQSEIPEHLKEHFPKKTRPSVLARMYSSKREMYRELQQVVKTPLDTALCKYRGSSDAADARKEQFKKGVVFLIHGPPACGKSTLARSLSKYYRIPVLSLDQVILSALEDPRDPVHHKILAYITNPTISAQQSQAALGMQTPPGSSAGKPRDPGKPRAPATAKPQSKATKAPPAQKLQLPGADVPRDRSDPDLVFQSKTLRYKNPLTDETTEVVTCILPDDLLVQLISWRLYQQDCRRGAVFDGIGSDFVESAPSVLRIVLTALEARRNIHVLTICDSFRDFCIRLQRNQRLNRKNGNYAQVMRDMAGVRSMSEEEYRSLPAGRRKWVDDTTAQYAEMMRIQKEHDAARAAKLTVLPPPEVLPEAVGLVAKPLHKGAGSSHKLPAITEDMSDHKSMASKSNAETANQGSAVKSTSRGQTAKHSVLKLKGKPGPLTKDREREGTTERSLRDAWRMLLKGHAEGQLPKIAHSDAYKSHKAFFATLKEYMTIATRWTAAGKVETLRRPQRSDASKDGQSGAGKKRNTKLRDLKAKPKDRTETERAERERAVIERVKSRYRRKRAFGVKHHLIMRKNTVSGDNNLISFDITAGPWRELPSYEKINKTTEARLDLPKSAMYTVRQRPTTVPPVVDQSILPFQFVALPNEAPSVPVVVSVAPSTQSSRQAVKEDAPSPDRIPSGGKDGSSVDSRGSKLGTGLKPDRTKIAKSAKTRPIGSAMPRESPYTEKDSKVATPTDPSLIYPAYAKAKAFSEPRCRPVHHFRWLLPPFGNTTLRLLLRSDQENTFQGTFTFKIVDYPEAEYPAQLKGRCRYFDLFQDLTRLFPREIWVETIQDDARAPVYAETDRKLYFGPLVHGKKKPDVLGGRCAPQHVYRFVLKNPYKRPLSTHFCVAKRPGSNAKEKVISPDFTVLPDRLTLAGNEEVTVQIFAHPASQGRCEDTLYAFTEFNPAPTQIILSCLSIRPQAEVLTKTLIIEKVPIRETGVGNIEVRNKTLLLPIKWRLLGTESLPPEFIFDTREGILKPIPDVQFIPVKFVSTSDKPVSHAKKPLRLEFSAEDPDVGVVGMEGVVLSGESYDLMLDIQFPKIQESVLDFGVCRVGEEVTRQITVKNRTKNDCGYHFFAVFEELAKKMPVDLLKSLIEFQPANGLLTSADRPVTITIVCRPKFEVELKLEKVVRCQVLDPARAFQRVAEIPIKTTVTAAYTKFILAPAVGDLRFPCSLPLQKRTRLITLQNVGVHDISYTIRKTAPLPLQQPSAQPSTTYSKSKPLDPANKSPLNAKPSTTSTHSVKKQDQAALAALQAGPFSVKPLQGTVKPNDTATITLDFWSDAIGAHADEYLLDIPDRDPSQHPTGLVYKVSGDIALPTVDTKDLETIFLEHLVLPADTVVLPEAAVLDHWLAERSVYFPKKRQLLVQYTFVGTKRKLNFRFTNPTKVACTTYFVLKGFRPGKNATDGFALHPTAPLSIDPHQFVQASVTFSPTISGKFQVGLEVLTDAAFMQPIKTLVFAFDIIAEALLPNIRILEPTFRDRRKQLSLVFPKLFVGQTAALPVALNNDTLLPVTLLVKVRGTDDVFQVISAEKYGAGDAESTTFPAKSERSYMIQFQPTLPGRHRRYLDITCVDNICPDTGVLLKGEAIQPDVILDGLLPVSYERRMRLLNTMGPQYEDILMEPFLVSWGDGPPSQTAKWTFRILNQTAEWVRYDWSKLSDLVVMNPRAGHIRPQSAVPLTVTFAMTDEAKTYVLPLNCSISGIQIPDNYDVEIQWHADRTTLQVVTEHRRPRPDSGALTVPSMDKLPEDVDAEHGKEKKDTHKKPPMATTAKKTNKKQAKKESVHRKGTVEAQEAGKRRESDQKKPVTHSAKPDEAKKPAKEPKTGEKTPEHGEVEPTLTQTVMAPAPEPPYTLLPNQQRNVLLVLTAVTGYAKFQHDQLELLFKETFILEKRRLSFLVRNTGNVVITYTAGFLATAEACIGYMEQMVQRRTSQAKGVVVTEDAPVQSLTPSLTGRGEKGRHASPRGLTAVSTTDTTTSREPPASGGSKKKRRVSKDTASSDPQPRAQETLPPGAAARAGKNSVIRRIDASMFRNMGKGQTADLRHAFVVTPGKGQILPGGAETFQVDFIPDEPMEYVGCLVVEMDNQDPNGLPLILPTYGFAKLPLIHFGTENEPALRMLEISGTEYRVMDLDVIGISTPVQRRLLLTNPTDTPYVVQVTCLDDTDAAKPPFEFGTSQATVAAGKRTPMDIRFLPHSLGKFDSKWRIDVPTHQLTVPLLLVATVRDATVTLHPPILAFKPMLPGMKRELKITLINAEAIPLHFNVDLAFFKGITDAVWTVSPLHGTIPAAAEVGISVVFQSSKEFKLEAPLLVNVERRSRALRCIMEHNVIVPAVEVVYISDGHRTIVDVETTVDFGQNDLHSVYKRAIQITNLGPINTEYTIGLFRKGKDYEPITRPYFAISPGNGLCAQNTTTSATLTYSPKSMKDIISNLYLLLDIEFGKRYTMPLRHTLHSLDVEFSFDQCDFGSVLISRDCPGTGSTVPLVIANQTSKTVAIDLLNYNLPSSIAFEFEALILQPGHSTLHTVMFLPVETGKVTGSLTFLINSSVTRTLTLTGEGVPLVLEVPVEMRNLSFAKVTVGKESSLQITVLNRSKTEIEGTVNLQGAPSIQELIGQNVLVIGPATPITILPMKSASVHVKLTPGKRIPQFQSKIIFTTEQKVTRELAIITGSCPGIDVSLDESMVDFASLVLSGSLTRNVVMKNDGEIGAQFTWDAGRLEPHFAIRPKCGYIAGKSDVILEITFAPKSLNPDIRIMDIGCVIAGNRTQVKMSLIGACVTLPAPKETVTFECPVRQTESKMLAITNPTLILWDLRPQLHGTADHWLVPSNVTVKPNTTENFEVIFRPLRIAVGGTHAASVAVILPSGQAVVYGLAGRTLPPKPNGRITRDVPCRVEFKEKLLVTNWLPKTQSFRVIFEYVKPDKPDPGVEVTGKDIVHLPGLAQTEYELRFKALRDKDVNQIYTYRVVFRCDDTGEFQYYDVQYRIVKGPPYEGKTVVSTVRSLKRDSVKIRNPLETPITVTCAVSGAPVDLVVDPVSAVTIGGKKELEVFMEYFPLKPGTVQLRLDGGSLELGMFSIDLTLQALPAPPEPPVQCETALGTVSNHTCKIFNYSRNRVDFTVKIVEGGSEFQLSSEKSVLSLLPGSATVPTEQPVELTFDPSQLGDFKGRLVATSPVAGEFQFPLVGRCVRPKPRGPYTVQANGETVPVLEVRNPFNRTCSFGLNLSNRVFQCKETLEGIKAKKSVVVGVGLNPGSLEGLVKGGVAGLVTAQLTVTPKSEGTGEEGGASCSWVYFLQAEI